jgi:hypothetical protein
MKRFRSNGLDPPQTIALGTNLEYGQGNTGPPMGKNSQLGALDNKVNGTISGQTR